MARDSVTYLAPLLTWPAASASPALRTTIAILLKGRSLAIDEANIVIIGGGVVGCAIARALSERVEDLFLLEALPKLGLARAHATAGGIHSGLVLSSRVAQSQTLRAWERADLRILRDPRGAAPQDR